MLAPAALLLVALAAAAANYQAWHQSKENERSSDDNRALTCNTARLISYVPAVQFEGEPQANFVGWISSRRDLLVEVRDRKSCSTQTTRLLRNRVELDRRLLEDLKK